MVTVIIPMYNVEMYIGECLDSLRKQIYQNFEVVVVNDGSTDNSAAVVKRYISEYQMNIRLIEQENQGVSRARNVGVENAQGDYFCFVDADDMLEKHYLERMVQQLEENKCDICVCQNSAVYDKGDVEDKEPEKTKGQVKEKYELLKDLLYGKIKVGIWALLISKTTMGEIRFAEGCAYSEDLEVVWKLFATCRKACILDEKLYIYRVREGSAMGVVDDRRMQGLHLFQQLEGFIKSNAEEFFDEYKKYGVARWVWATLWQEALAADDFSQFRKSIEKYNPHDRMKALISFPQKKVVLFSLLYLVSPCFYYKVVNCGKRIYRRKM